MNRDRLPSAHILAAAALLAMAWGCSGSNGTEADTEPADTLADTVGQDTVLDVPADTLPDTLPDMAEDTLPDTAEDTLKPDTPEDIPPDTGPTDPFGFDIRIPQTHTLECEGGPMGPQTMDQIDVDWVCTFDHNGISGHVYLQATPVSCYVIMGPMPVFEVAGAWISIDGVLTDLENGGYEWGGNHHNDWIHFDYQGQTYKFYHSSFGWGWHKCQPMDCIQVYSPGMGDLVEDGCTKDRTLPAVCVQVEDDGTYPELVDNFEPCPGDPNYQ